MINALKLISRKSFSQHLESMFGFFTFEHKYLINFTPIQPKTESQMQRKTKEISRKNFTARNYLEGFTLCYPRAMDAYRKI